MLLIRRRQAAHPADRTGASQYQALKLRLQRYYEAEAEGPLTVSISKDPLRRGLLPVLHELRHRLFPWAT